MQRDARVEGSEAGKSRGLLLSVVSATDEFVNYVHPVYYITLIKLLKHVANIWY